MSFLFFSFAAHFEAKEAGELSTLFDVGGIVGKRCLDFILKALI